MEKGKWLEDSGTMWKKVMPNKVPAAKLMRAQSWRCETPIEIARRAPTPALKREMRHWFHVLYRKASIWRPIIGKAFDTVYTRHYNP